MGCAQTGSGKTVSFYKFIRYVFIVSIRKKHTFWSWSKLYSNVFAYQGNLFICLGYIWNIVWYLPTKYRNSRNIRPNCMITIKCSTSNCTLKFYHQNWFDLFNISSNKERVKTVISIIEKFGTWHHDYCAKFIPDVMKIPINSQIVLNNMKQSENFLLKRHIISHMRSNTNE